MTIEIVEFKCPYCGHILGEEEAKNAQLMKQKDIDEKVKQKSQQQIEQLQIEHARDVQQVIEKNRLEKEKEVSKKVDKILAEEKMRMELKYSLEIAEKNRQIEASRLDVAERIEEKIRQAISDKEAKYNQKEKEFETQLKRIEAHNKELLAEVEKQKRTLDSIPPELKGTAGEFVLIDELKEEFRTDDITGKRVGAAMADIVQNVVTEKGERLPIPIVYDKKMGKLVTASDIIKAKNYKIIHNTDHCLIVTEDIKRTNMKHSRSKFTEEREGVLLVHPLAVVDVAKRIRSFLIENSKKMKNNNGRESKQSKLYDYLTSPEYGRDVQTKLDAKSKLDDLQRKEEDYHRTTWTKRKEFIEKWFEADRKNNRIITDITQEDKDSDQPAPNEEDGPDPPS